MKKAIWLYFFLLIFEGGLRKWFLPQLSTPLLLVRDPIALWLIIEAFRRRLLGASIYVIGMEIAGVISIFAALLFSHGSLGVALFGARIFMIHFPLMFVMGKIMSREDVAKFGKVVLWISLPMTILIILQFYSPQSAWVNQGVGGDVKGAGFEGALGYFRPPGTFSFTSGTTQFYSLAACFIFFFWLNPSAIKRSMLIFSTIALLAAIPLSISRSLFFQVLVSLVFVGFSISQRPKYIGRMVGVIIAFGVLFVILGNLDFFHTASEAFISRFETANDVEGGVKGVFLDRYLGGMIGALKSSSEMPFFGYGIGMGTNVGAQLLTGSTTFLISEGEWGRLIGEMGALIGIFVILLRVGYTLKISIIGYKRLRYGELLPWMLLSYGIFIIPQGQWAQPTSLGFSTLVGGLILASFNTNSRTEKPKGS